MPDTENFTGLFAPVYDFIFSIYIIYNQADPSGKEEYNGPTDFPTRADRFFSNVDNGQNR